MRIQLHSLLLFALLGAVPLVAQHRVSVGAVAGIPVGGWKTVSNDTRGGLSADYEYRVARSLGLEAGFQPLWAAEKVCSRTSCATETYRLLFTQFGLRGYLPLKSDRVEVSAGAGGGYVHWPGSRGGFYNDWLWQVSGRVQFALDAKRRFWLGPSARFYSDGGRPTQQWLVVGADFSWKPAGH